MCAIISVLNRIENIMSKGGSTGYQHFSFSTHFFFSKYFSVRVFKATEICICWDLVKRLLFVHYLMIICLYFVVGHCPIYQKACFSSNLCWNWSEILEVMHSHSQVIVCYLAGHDHQGGEAMDEKGITHITEPAVLENNNDADFGTAYLYNDWLRIEGNGRVKNLEIRLRFKIDVQDVHVPNREDTAETCI